MLPHTGLFLLGKVALQMRIRRRLKTQIRFQTTFVCQFFCCHTTSLTFCTMKLYVAGHIQI